MRKLLSILLPLFLISCSSLDMSTLQCRDMHLTSTTTLGQVQDTCLLKEQGPEDNGLYNVIFVNDATKKPVSCYFASKKRSALLNSCK